MITNNMRFLCFNKETFGQYLQIERNGLKKFNRELGAYRIGENEKIYLLMFKPKIFKEYFVGRCIVMDTAKISNKDELAIVSGVHGIPIATLREFPLLIEDIFIHRSKRKYGYGKIFAEHVLKDIGNNGMCLKAQGDGLWFWNKLGFKHIKDDVFVK